MFMIKVTNAVQAQRIRCNATKLNLLHKPSHYCFAPIPHGTGVMITLHITMNTRQYKADGRRQDSVNRQEWYLFRSTKRCDHKCVLRAATRK